jgi:hypothetical protein
MEHAIAIGTEQSKFQLDDLIDVHRTLLEGTLERVTGIEPAWPAWKFGSGGAELRAVSRSCRSAGRTRCRE